MKAYEFYVLLGKYKRRSISSAEYERFVAALESVRTYRFAFTESTGEYRPHFPSKSNHRRHHTARKEVNSGRSETRTDTSVLEEEPLKTDAVSTIPNPVPGISTSHPVPFDDEVVTGVIRQHSELKRIRKRKHHKHRWFRLIQAEFRHNPFILFMVAVISIAVGIVLVIKPGYSVDKSVKLDRGGDLQALSQNVETTQFENSTLTSGKFVSDADRLLAVDPKAFTFSIDAVPETQAPVGIEAAIEKGLEGMFPAPNLSATLPETPDLVNDSKTVSQPSN